MKKYLFLLFLVTLPNVSYCETLLVKATLATIAKNHNEIKNYYLVNNKYPTSLNERDSWDRELVYNQINQSSYTLYSVGKNGIDEQGLNDDLVSFKTVNRSFYPEMGVTKFQAWLRLILILLVISIAIAGYVIIKLKRSNKFKNLRSLRSLGRANSAHPFGWR